MDCLALFGGLRVAFEFDIAARGCGCGCGCCCRLWFGDYVWEEGTLSAWWWWCGCGPLLCA